MEAGEKGDYKRAEVQIQASRLKLKTQIRVRLSLARALKCERRVGEQLENDPITGDVNRHEKGACNEDAKDDDDDGHEAGLLQ